MPPRGSRRPAAAAPDLSRFGRLAEYRRKRRFWVTPEPPGAPRAGHRAGRRGRRFAYVVQKHRASHLHYDLRLEHDGVMLSWAVPKGPSLDPSARRLAMRTEDHPLEYNDFEGVIPEGEYGAGTVMIWDRGSWEPESDDVDRAVAKGELKLRLFGEKLTGSWVLVRTRDRQWLLIKHRDSAASSEDVTVTRPLSVVSGRTMGQIAYLAEASERQLVQAAAADPPAVSALTPAAGGPAAQRPSGPRRQPSRPGRARPPRRRAG